MIKTLDQLKKKTLDPRRPHSAEWLSAISLKREEIKQLNFVYLCVCFQRIKTHPKAKQ